MKGGDDSRNGVEAELRRALKVKMRITDSKQGDTDRQTEKEFSREEYHGQNNKKRSRDTSQGTINHLFPWNY